LTEAQGQTVTADALKTNHLQSEYEKWIAPFKLNIAGRRFSTDQRRPKLVITVVTERELSVDDKNLFLFGNGKSSYGSKISADGGVEYFSSGSRGSKGSCCSQIEKDELKRINQLLANLPDDNSFLPPNGRRLVLQIPEDEKFAARVYDLANAPDEILELLRLTKSGIRPHVLSFAPETQWTAHGNHPLDGGIAVTSDNQKIISSGLHEPIKIWHTDSHNLLQEIVNTPSSIQFNGLVLSPDNSIMVIQGWWKIGILDTKKWNNFREIEEISIDGKTQTLSKPQFIENGKFLLLESSEPALRIYDTKTWKRRDALPEIPAGTVSYYPTSLKSRAVYSLKDEQIILRDTNRQLNIATLEKAKIKYAAFSPDESLVAVITIQEATGNEWTKYKIKIWNADNGKFVRELRPFEQDFCESVEGLMWSPEGKYVLAATKAHIFFTSRGISIWNVESGRHRGELNGCPTKLNGLGFLSNKTKLITGCGDGIIRIWDLSDALTKISRFEKLVTEK
jgi:WD40 repeat protein